MRFLKKSRDYSQSHVGLFFRRVIQVSHEHRVPHLSHHDPHLSQTEFQGVGIAMCPQGPQESTRGLPSYESRDGYGTVWDGYGTDMGHFDLRQEILEM